MISDGMYVKRIYSIPNAKLSYPERGNKLGKMWKEKKDRRIRAKLTGDG
jgi:hypothetical protein